MIQKAADTLASFCVKEKWISQKEYAWCQYALELRMNQLIFVLYLLILALVTGAFAELFSFSATLFLFRQRFGGWHANCEWNCFVFSAGVVLVCCFILGPALLLLGCPQIIILDASILITAWRLSPVYPPQVHFTNKEIMANKKRKNFMLLGLLVIQAISILYQLFYIAIYTTLGLTITIIFVVLEYRKNINKGENK